MLVNKGVITEKEIINLLGYGYIVEKIMTRLHLLDKPEGKAVVCLKCGMLLIFKHNDRKFTSDEQIWLASEVNCSKMLPQYSTHSPFPLHYEQPWKRAQ